MTDTQHQGVMAMVKIDGGKVKQLREQKGLTQLYVATVVQVTTDTISRWENKRYPTIKKENGLRLAEALEVELDDILETHPAEEQKPETEAEATSPPITAPKRSLTTRWPLLLLTLGLVLLGTPIGWYYLHQDAPPGITARRILPRQCTANQPFPVTIEITGPEAMPVTLILKEQLPEAIAVLTAEPPLPSPGAKNNTLKWLQKIKGRMLFTYIATISEQLPENQVISGSVAASNNADNPVTITGNNRITLSNHHWADSDGDNIISDQEILTVYDQYGDLEKLGIDVDLIEEIWLGSGYSWDSTEKTYVILQ